MVIYFLMLICIFFMAIVLCKDNKKSKLFLTCSFLAFFIIAAVRSETVGADTRQYIRFFNSMYKLDFKALINARNEIGFGLLCKSLYMMTENSQILLIVSSAIINFSVYKFVKKYSDNYVISVLCYLFLNYFFMYMNIMRQGLALAIILFAYDALHSNKKKKFIILVLLASLFHSSAFVCLLVLLFDKIKFDKKGMIYIIPIFAVVFLFGNDIFAFTSSISQRVFGKYGDYIGSQFDVSNYYGTLIIFLFHLSIFLLSLFVIEKDSTNNEIDYMRKILALGLMMCVLGIRVSILNRLYSYFLIYELIWIPKIISKSGKNKSLLCLILFSVFISYWIIIMVCRPEWYCVVPYELYFA